MSTLQIHFECNHPDLPDTDEIREESLTIGQRPMPLTFRGLTNPSDSSTDSDTENCNNSAPNMINPNMNQKIRGLNMPKGKQHPLSKKPVIGARAQRQRSEGDMDESENGVESDKEKQYREKDDTLQQRNLAKKHDDGKCVTRNHPLPDLHPSKGTIPRQLVQPAATTITTAISMPTRSSTSPSPSSRTLLKEKRSLTVNQTKPLHLGLANPAGPIVSGLPLRAHTANQVSQDVAVGASRASQTLLKMKKSSKIPPPPSILHTVKTPYSTESINDFKSNASQSQVQSSSPTSHSHPTSLSSAMNKPACTSSSEPSSVGPVAGRASGPKHSAQSFQLSPTVLSHPPLCDEQEHTLRMSPGTIARLEEFDLLLASLPPGRVSNADNTPHPSSIPKRRGQKSQGHEENIPKNVLLNREKLLWETSSNLVCCSFYSRSVF